MRRLAIADTWAGALTRQRHSGDNAKGIVMRIMGEHTAAEMLAIGICPRCYGVFESGHCCVLAAPLLE